MRLVIAFVIALASASTTLAQSSAGDAWPNRPLRIIVPLPAGSAADVVARLIGQRLQERFGQPFIVDNRGGASGTVGTEALARALPDGYTLGIASTSTHVTAAILNAKLPYDPIRAFAPVAMVGISPYVLVVHPSVPAGSVAELIALARTKPRALSYSSVGEASLAHLAGELFATMAGVELNHVPYRTSTQAIIDLNQGRIDMQFGIPASSLAFIRDGTLRALAVTTAQRVDDLPDVPTLSEAGLPGYEASLWIAVVMPAAVPPAIIAALNRAINAALGEPEIAKVLAAQAIKVAPGTPDELGARMRADIEKWRPLAAKAGLQGKE
jgi:tripartite-type tricarboxylate transporter receptor subunit TctC